MKYVIAFAASLVMAVSGAAATVEPTQCQSPPFQILCVNCPDRN
jgi:hypothetical protein